MTAMRLTLTCKHYIITNVPTLANTGVEMSPGHLLVQLQRRGINLLPIAADAEFVENITPREQELEDAVYTSMARYDY